MSVLVIDTLYICIIYSTDFQNPKIIHEFVEPTVIAKTIRNPCPPHLLSSDSHLPVVYMITPTYQRWTQKADLTRLCYTVMQVPQLHWIVVEDSEEKTVLVEKMLSGQYSCKPSIVTHLNIKSPTKVPNITPFLKRWGRNSLPHRGVVQRNLALRWLREAAVWDQLQGNGSGVVYFGDDDNVYDLRVFEEVSYMYFCMWCASLRMSTMGTCVLIGWPGGQPI